MTLKMLDGNDLPHELLLTKGKKTKLSIVELSKLAGPLMKVAIPLGKKVLAPLEITAAASATDAGIQKKTEGSGTTTLNKEMKGIMKIVQAIEDSNILLKGVTKTTNNETKEQKGGLLNMLLGTSGTSLLNLDEYADIGTHWIDLFCNRSNIVYFDSFLVLNMFLKKSRNLSGIKT